MKYGPHAVYLMKNLWSESNYKVGFSNNPTRRGVEVDHHYGVEPRILSTCWFPTEKDARAAEHIWHIRFKECRSDDHGGREWFSLTSLQVDEFTQWCSHSLDRLQLLDGLFKGHLNLNQVKQLTNRLFTLIPKPMPRDSIDLWVAQPYQFNYDNIYEESRGRFSPRNRPKVTRTVLC